MPSTLIVVAVDRRTAMEPTQEIQAALATRDSA
jgi:hypothetical protein